MLKKLIFIVTLVCLLSLTWSAHAQTGIDYLGSKSWTEAYGRNLSGLSMAVKDFAKQGEDVVALKSRLVASFAGQVTDAQALALYATADPALAASLRAKQLADGSWDSDVYTTALITFVLFETGLEPGTANTGLNYLLSIRNGDGGWGAVGSSGVAETSLVLLSLKKTGYVGDAVTIGYEWLLANQGASGNWGNLIDTSWASLALISSGSNPSELAKAISYLTLFENGDGGYGIGPSEESDPFTSALVLFILENYDPSLPGIQRGINYLKNFAGDELWINKALAFYNISEICYLLQDIPEAAPICSLYSEYLASFPDQKNNDYLSRKISLIAKSGGDVASLIAEMLGTENQDYGFGFASGYSSDPWDTVLVLRSLLDAGWTDITIYAKIFTYLTQAVNPDGSYGMQKNDPGNVYLSALVAEQLERLNSVLNSSALLTKTRQWIFSQYGSNGMFGNGMLETARALGVIIGLLTSSQITTSTNAITTSGLADGSWDNDLLTTAAVLSFLNKKKADLKVTAADIALSKDPVFSNETMSVKITVGNAGIQAVENVAVRVYSGRTEAGELLYSAEIPSIAAKGNAIVGFDWTAGEVGTNEILVSVDPFNTITEASELNNKVVKVIQVLKRVDLSISAADISILPEFPSPYDALNVVALVRNSGYMAAGSFTITLSEGSLASGGTILGEGTCSGITAQGSLAMVFNLTLPVGSHDLRVTVDPYNNVYEDDESNNEAGKSVSVEQRLDLAITNDRISFSNTDPIDGERVLVFASVSNLREEAVSNVPVAFYLGDPAGSGTLLGIVTIDAIAGGKTKTASLEWNTIHKEGQNAIWVVVDPENAIIEVDETNNRASGIINVLPPSGTSPVIISLPVREAKRGDTYVYDVEATDPNGDLLTYGLEKSPAGMAIDSQTGLISWTIPLDQPQTGNDVTVIVRDPEGNADPANHSATQSFSIFVTVDADGDGYDNRVDCNDNNPLVHPGAPEICNGIDDNCDGETDTGALVTFYRDADGDGYGNPGDTAQSCTAPEGYVANKLDCDDTNPKVNPGKIEIGDNGVDDDCNSTTPDNWSRAFIAAITDAGIIHYAKSNGDGTFANYKTVWDIGNYNSRGLTINDFNNDGYLDILAAGGVSNRVDFILFAGDGSGNFGKPVAVHSSAVTGSWGEDMASGDLNNDGYVDFIAGSESVKTIIALNNGKGKFIQQILELGGQGRGIDIADFNRDGILDFARARYSDGNVYVYTGNGDGTFSAGTLVAKVGSDPYGCVAADFDNDGVVDLIVNDTGTGDCSFFKGTGNATFSSIGLVPSLDTNRYTSLDAYDLSNDGNVDIVAADYNGYGLYYFPGNGDGTFGAKVRINVTDTANYVLAISAPQYRVRGVPYAIMEPQIQVIQPGGTASIDGSASHDSYGGSIVTYEWRFGDGSIATGPIVSHVYENEGVYNVVLSVKDNGGYTGICAGRVIVIGGAPVADAGGPYTFGESYANNGVYTVTLDGTGSTDDSGIAGYSWDFGSVFEDSFDGTVIDSGKWISSANVTQNGNISITGSGQWGTRYIVSSTNLFATAGLALYAKIRPATLTGSQLGMFGFKNTSSSNIYSQMPYAIYFNQNAIQVYENGGGVGQSGSFTRGTEYEIKIELTEIGAIYSYKPSGDENWNLLYVSGKAYPSQLKVAADVSQGVFTMDDVKVSLLLEGSHPQRQFAIGIYPVTLTVTDTSGQTASDSTIINIIANDPPVANPGGPYEYNESDGVGGQWYVAFDGSESSDDYGMLKYEWDFDASNGIQVDSTASSPVRVYTIPGTYIATLTITDHALQTNTATVAVVIASAGNPPVANAGGPYSVNEESAVNGTWTVDFQGCGSTDDVGISRYVWDFGDGDSETTYYCGEKINSFGAGTDLYGYFVANAGLRIVATENNTKVKVINLQTGATIGSATLAKYGIATNLTPGAGVYFKVQSDKPVIAYETNLSNHATFAPSLESGPVGNNFVIYYYTASGYYVFAWEDTVVTFFNTAGTQIAQKVMKSGTYWNPGLTNNTVYKVTSIGKISMQNDGINAFTSLPSSDGDGAGRLFYAAINGTTSGGSLAVFAYENAAVSVFDMDTDSLFFEKTLSKGETLFRTAIGTKRIRIESSGDIEVWAGDTEGGSTIADFGDDISSAGGKNSTEFYLNTLRDGAVIFAPYDDTQVDANGTVKVLQADEYWLLPGGGLSQHITSSKPIVIQTLGRANAFNDFGTFLGGRSAIRHYYNAPGTYNLTLTVVDNAGLTSTQTTTVTVNAADPPVADPGGPYVINEKDAIAGVWKLVLDGSKSTDDYAICKYEWDLDDSNGIQVDTTGSNPEVTYVKPGIYTVTLSVWDNAMQKVMKSTTVTVLANEAPDANAGGPYVQGEKDASFGKWNVQLDGSGSTDDFAIYSYEWIIDRIKFDLSGTVIDNTKWIYSANVTQNDGISVTGASSWGSRYLVSASDYAPSHGLAFQVRVLPAATSGAGMFGFKNNNTDYNYTQMQYAVYFYNQQIYIYEGGTSRGTFVPYTANVPYDVRIILQDLGALYFFKPASSETWTRLYESSYATSAPLKIGMTVNSGTFKLQEIDYVKRMSVEPSPGFEFNAPGVYDVSLIVTDNALQSDTDETTISIINGQPPVADAGGPYTVEVGNMITFNGTGSTDDYGIVSYEWTFGDKSGPPADLQYTGNGATPAHAYRQVGTYDVILKVTDRALNTNTDTVTVNVIQGNPPVANAGGSYTCGAGGPPAYFDGTGSTDDFGIVEYRWDFDSAVDSDGNGNADDDIDAVGPNPFYIYTVPTGIFVNDAFAGTVVNGNDWLSNGAVQNEKITITGANAWNRYIYSVDNYKRANSLVFQTRVLPVNATGVQRMVWGLKKTSTDYSIGQLPHAIDFNAGAVSVFENGGSRGQFGTYTRGVPYDLKIELGATGASYYMKEAAADSWTMLYQSTTSITTSPLKLGTTVYSGTFDFDNFYGKGPDAYTAILTVEDGAGQTSNAEVKVDVAANLPPHVIAVPWVARDPSVPHETYNGKSVRLKGIVRDADAKTYQWDFGDGTKSAVTNITSPYDLSVSYTYPDVVSGTPFVAVLTVWDSKNQTGSDAYNVIVKNKSLSVETNIAIDEGLWYLHQQQTRSTIGVHPSGSWYYSSYYSSPTASAIQAFEINGHFENGDNKQNPYAETVNRGLKFLFTKISASSIGPQTYGDPDTNGNGIGVGVNDGRPIYQGGMVMDAIASSRTPLARTVTGGTNIARRTYFDVLTDMADMFAWGQYDGATGGGWRYEWNDAPDNSAAQWGAIGLHAAEEIFNIPIPQWVKDRNDIWLNSSYSSTSSGIGFGYTGEGYGIATSPCGMVQLAFDDKTTDDYRWKSTEKYIASRWSEPNATNLIHDAGTASEHNRNYYAMYAFTKAMRVAQPEAVTKLKSNGFDWYNDPVGGIARCVIDDQAPDGRFEGSDYINNHLRTAWGIIMLSQTLFVQRPVADAGRNKVWGVNIPLTFDGSGSYHLDPFRHIAKYEWDFNGDGIFESSGTDPKATYTYTDAPSVLPKTYLVSLRVTDDNFPSLTDTDTVEIVIAVPPHPPVAVPGGLYTGTAGLPVALDGSGSFDIDPTDYITKYEWELDSQFPYNFGEATGVKPSFVWAVPGTYNIGLRVSDNGVMNDLDGDGTIDDNEKLGDQAFTSITIVPNQPPVARLGGPYIIDEGSSVIIDGSSSSDPNGDPIFYSWDTDNDGEFDDGTGPTVEIPFADNGAYPVRLMVTDTLLSNSETTVVIVNDLAPQAEFAFSPESQYEGLDVSFIDQSTSYPDEIVSWAWDFGGAGTSSERNPIFVFDGDGTYQVSLIVTDEDGSTNSVVHNLVIKPVELEAEFTWSPTSPIEGAIVAFKDQSTSSPDSITGWAWDFGGIGNSTLRNPSFTFNDNGIYKVSLTVSKAGGFTNTISHEVVVSDAAPIAEFAWTPASPVEGSAVVFTDQSVSSPDTIVSWVWDFGGIGSSTEANPVFTFADNGTYSVSLTVTDEDGSASSVTHEVVVTDAAPIAEFTWTPAIPVEGSSAVFTDQSVSSPDTIASWAWDFGGIGSSTEANPVFTFADNGTYSVSLTVTDEDGSASSVTHEVVVTDAAPIAEYAWIPASPVEGSAVVFTDQSVSSPDTIVSWVWDFDGIGSSTEANPAFTFADNGTYSVSLTVTDEDGSASSVTHEIVVTDAAPNAKFVWTPASPVEGSAVVFTDQSVSSPDTIVSWVWDFGGIGSSTEANPTFAFADNGTYSVSLTVTDEDGSASSVMHEIVVTDAAPNAEFAWTPASPVEGSAVVFTDQSVSSPDTIVSWAWDFGGIGSSTEANPAFAFADNGTYSVSLTVTDEDGSASSVTHEIVVTDAAPNAEFAWTPASPVEGSAVVFTDQSVSSPDTIASWAWDFGGIGSSTEANPTFAFVDNGTYSVSLTVTDEDGSASSVTHEVVVTDAAPNAEFAWTPASPVEGEAVTFTNQSVSLPDTIVSWAWNFGGLGSSGDANPTFAFADNGTYLVSLTVTDEDGSASSVTHEIVVYNAAPIVEAGPDQTVFANSPVLFNGTFTDPGIMDTHSIVWDFGDTTTSEGSLALTHVFVNEGTYTVHITVTDDDGGVGIDSLVVVVQPENKPPVANAGPDQALVVAAGNAVTVTLDGSGSTDPDGDELTYTWTGTFGTLSGVNPSVELDAGNYNITLTVSDGEYASADTVSVTVTKPTGKINVTVKLVDSNGKGIRCGKASYFDGSWKSIGSTDANGEARIELPAGTYNFGITYIGATDTKFQDIGIDPVVVFTTKRVEVRLVTGAGSGLPGGCAKLYSTTYRFIGITDKNGSAYIELLPVSYKFGMEYKGSIVYKTQDVGTNSVVVFTTLKVTVRLVDCKGEGLPGGHATYLQKTWMNIGTTDGNGNTYIELLGGIYKFGMEYRFGAQYKSQDIEKNPVVVFKTVKVKVKFVDHSGHGISGGCIKYYRDKDNCIDGEKTDHNGCASIELLPCRYKFGMEYSGLIDRKECDFAKDGVIVFQSNRTEHKVHGGR